MGGGGFFAFDASHRAEGLGIRRFILEVEMELDSIFFCSHLFVV
jgi:hypothetical protein